MAAPHTEAAEAYGPVRGEAVRIVLCVLTLHRPVGLARCLDAIAALELPDEEAVDLRVVVVDNDAGCSGRRVVDRLPRTWPVDYLVEPDRGIPHARNRAVAAAIAADADLVGFVDDDEAPAADWLVAMLDARRRTGAAVLMGRSVATFVEAPAPWVVQGGFFEYERFRSGDSFPFWYARTSGILIDRTALPAGPSVFDERFRLSGGSDLHLFSRMHEAGARFAWVDDAVVEETVPATRTTLGWLVRRTYRYGTTSSLTLVAEGASPLRRARRLTGAFVFTAIGLVRQLRRAAATSVRVTAVRVLLQLAYGAGLVTGVLGIQYPEYRRVHGR